MKTIFGVSILLFFPLLLSAQLQTKAYLLIDDSKIITIDSISHISDSWQDFEENKKYKLGYNRFTNYWLRIIVTNHSNRMIKRFVLIQNPNLDSVEYYFNDTYNLQGDRTYGRNEYIHSPAFLFNIKAHSIDTLYFKIQKSISFIDFQYAIHTENSLLELQHDNFVLIILLGVFLMFSIFNFVLYYVSKDNTYLYYAFYLLLSWVYIGISNGVFKFYIFSHFLYFSELRIYTSFIVFSCFNFFIITYLKLAEVKPKWYSVFLILNGVHGTNIIISIIVYLLAWHNILLVQIVFNYILVYTLFILTIIILFRQIIYKNSESKFALLGFSIIALWVLFYLIEAVFKVQLRITENWLVIVGILQSIAFSFVLAIRYQNTIKLNQKLLLEMIETKDKSIELINEGEKQERKRIASLLHDNFGSRLAAIKLMLISHKTTEAEFEIDKVSKDIRNLSHEILPKSLQEGALSASIKEHIIQLNINPQLLTIELYEFDFPKIIHAPWIIDLFLITQEVISNSIKHANASKISLELYFYETHYIFIFMDNGNGFDVQHNMKSFGLTSLNNRVDKYKGVLQINSNNNGTEIIIQLPA